MKTALEIFLVIFSGLVIALYILRKFDHHKGFPELSFKAFKSLYVVNPDSWHIDDWDTLKYYNKGDYYVIQMKSFVDSIRLFIYNKQLMAGRANLQSSKLTSELLILWQNDIDIFNEQVKKELQG